MVNLEVSWWRSRRREWLGADPPERAIIDSLPNRALRVALWKLPPRQRAVVALRYLEDLTECETAGVLGCSVGTVKSQTAKAITKLRPTLDKALLETS
jgi:RNA polymerase sigma factor (sigma-70 family)